MTKRFLGARYFGFEFITSFQPFLQGLYNRCDKPSFLRVRPNIYPAIENNVLFSSRKYAEKILLQSFIVCSNTKPFYNSSIFSFGCLRIYPTITPPIHF